jgi:hypothetical protein
MGVGRSRREIFRVLPAQPHAGAGKEGLEGKRKGLWWGAADGQGRWALRRPEAFRHPGFCGREPSFAEGSWVLGVGWDS